MQIRIDYFEKPGRVEDRGMNPGKVLGRYQNGKWAPVRQIKEN